MNPLQNSILGHHFLFPVGPVSTRGLESPKLDIGVPPALLAWSQNENDTRMVIQVNSRDVVYGIVDDYHRAVETATEMAEVTMLRHESADEWWEPFVHRVVDDYHGLVEQPTSMVKDEVTTVEQEYPKLLWKAMSTWYDCKKAGAAVTHEQDYHSRIAALREMAEDEGFTVAEASIKDLWIFFSTLSPSQKAELAVNPNENLRAIWDDDHGNHVGIQFRGAGVLQYVIFKGPTDSPERIYDAGRGDIEVVRQLVKDFDLENLLGIYGV
jgi:hypothetical protein